MSRKPDIGRRDFLTAVGAVSAAAALTGFTLGGTSDRQKNREMLVYIGTYTSGESESEGIYICRLDPETGALDHRGTVKNVIDPSFLTLDASGKYLYAVNETLEFQGKKSGSVSAFAVDQRTGGLTLLNVQPTQGGAPCYVSVSANGKFVLVANYVGGSAAVFPVNKDGSLGPTAHVEQFAGSGPNKERQESSHAHAVILDPGNDFAFVNDLGTDRVMIFRFDDASGRFTPNPIQPFYQTKAGAGPRHLEFHPNGKFAFLINELDMTISPLAYDKQKGTLKEMHSVLTVPAAFSGENTCADIHVTPDGAFLYGSNRGHDSIVSFKIDNRSGRLKYIDHVPAMGKTPRNFAIDPTGSFLIAANQGSDSVVTYRIERRTGKLLPTGRELAVPSPVCLKVAGQIS